MSKKKTPLWIKIVGTIVVLMMVGSWLVSPYNNLVTKEEVVVMSWANVESQYQRRFDLIPNLVNTVKGYAEHEQETFTKVTAARSAWAQAGKSGSVGGQIAAAGMMESALSRLLVTVEAYPNLKADAAFLELQTELSGTENRIQVARKRYNESVTNFNIYRRVFPQSIWANMFGFDAKEVFEVQDEAAEKAVEVKF